MKSILEISDHSGKMYVVIPKIREVLKGLGNVVIKFDNGDSRSVETMDSDKTMMEICEAIEKYYN